LLRRRRGRRKLRSSPCSRQRRQAQATTDVRLYGAADLAFHMAFFTQCGNRYLVDAYTSVGCPLSEPGCGGDARIANSP
jgi:DNA-binding GntR family transcriptional regulator